MKMDLFRSRTAPKKERSQKAERAVKSQPPREGETTEIDIDSLARVMSTEAEVEAAYSQGGSTERSSRSTARTTTVDDILDSDDDNDEIFMDEDEDNEDSGLRTSQTWDESYKNAQKDATSPSAISAPGIVSTKPNASPRGSPASAKSLNAAAVEYAAIEAASSALCAVPGKLAKRADLLGNISDSDSSPATRQRSDASNASTDDDDDDDMSASSFEDKNKGGSGGHSSEDYTDDEDEGEDGYKPGGYHPVKLGEVYNQRYVVIKKLGWGHFSTVWMVKDRQLAKATGQGATKEKQFFALKVQKSAEHYTEAAIDEVALLDCVAQERKKCEAMLLQKKMDVNGVAMKDTVEHAKHVATLHDSFFHTGPNGRHMVMVFGMLGCNLLSVIKAYNYRGIPIPVVKNMIRGMCMGLDFLHRKCSIIHTDLKPENVNPCSVLIADACDDCFANMFPSFCVTGVTAVSESNDGRYPRIRTGCPVDSSAIRRDRSPCCVNSCSRKEITRHLDFGGRTQESS